MTFEEWYSNAYSLKARMDNSENKEWEIAAWNAALDEAVKVVNSWRYEVEDVVEVTRAIKELKDD